MQGRKNIFIVLITIFIVTMATSTNAQDLEGQGYIVKTGEVAPDFTVMLDNGTLWTLSEHRGEVIMLQFTASWCGVCRKEMPHIEKEIWQLHKDKPFTLIGVDIDEPMEKVIHFKEKMNISYPLALDPGSKVFQKYAETTAGVTRNVIINTQGEIVYLTRLFDMKEFSAMKEIIQNLLIDKNKE